MACALALLASAGGSVAQVPGFPSAKPGSSKYTASEPARDASTPTPVETRERTTERLRRQIAELGAARANPPPAPPGIQPDEVTDLAEARSALVNASEVQLNALAELDKSRATRESAEAIARHWQGFEQPPPYSILMVDDLRDEADAERSRIAAIDRAVAHLRTESERYASELRRSEEALRRTQEVADRADDAEERVRAIWRRDLAQMRLRALAGRAAVAQVLQQFQAEERAARNADLTLLTRKIEIASRHASFDEADLARAKERLVTVGAGLRAEQKKLAGRLVTSDKEQIAATQALAALRARTDAPPDELKVAESRLQAADAWVAALRLERDLLDGMVTLAEDQMRNWEARRIALNDVEADARFAAGERLRTAASRLTRWRGYIDNLFETQRARLADVETGLLRADALPAVTRHDQETAHALRHGLATFERVQAALGLAVRALDRWVADIDAQRGTASFQARLAVAWSGLKSWVRDVWNFELFAVEDTAIVDGSEVKTARGVTVGKSVGAFLVFIVGYWLAAAAGRRLERGFVSRGFDARRVRNYRRWALAGVAALLALFTLNVARIPLTVFAFLGGALAIGVGFGTQTIIRNFISGLIVLAERQIQIGDIIEVDGVTGTVIAVDLRSSTVLGFEGVETTVPNSVLLENKVTNWTHTDRRVRRSVKLGVAYGSPLREAADVLEGCAKRHGVVLDDPAPLVVFEDFGADALVFTLYFWVELRPGVNAGQVASDLRFMIAKGLAEAGIAMPFPQRDLHFDASAPLRVELTKSATG